jgi:hypothetical protein
MAIAAYNSSVLVTAQPSIGTTNEATATTDNQTWTISSAPHRYFDPTVAAVTQAKFDEIQNVLISGIPTGGTFTLTFGAQTTTAIAYNATAAAVQAALVALSSIGAGNVSVTGGPGPLVGWQIEFTGSMAKTAEALITATSSLTGGTTPAVGITRQVGGSNTFTTITTGFTLYRAPARITFALPTPGAVVQFSSASYFAYSTMVEAASGDYGAKMGMADATIFNSAGAKAYVPTLIEGVLKLNTFWINQTRANSLLARDLLVVSFVLPSGNRYEGFCYASDMDLKYDPKNVVTQDITFQLTNEFYSI